MGYKPILTFDTSGIGGTNCLVDEPDLDALIAGFTSGFHTRFTFTSVSEIIATTCGDRRRRQLGVCRRLLPFGDCIEPQHEIIRKMVKSFEDSASFDWSEVNVRFPEAEIELVRQESFSDELSQQEREEARALDAKFFKIYDNAKPAFDRLFAEGRAKAPTSVSELVMRLQVEGGAFWTLAGDLYARVAKSAPDERTVRRFVEQCPPFNALMIALCAAQYDRCIRPRNDGPSLRSGRNDTFMSVCLPYCEQFVTNDPKQLRCFEEVISICKMHAAVRSYDDFRSGFLLPGTTICPAA
jgi:hypothetical protein